MKITGKELVELIEEVKQIAKNEIIAALNNQEDIDALDEFQNGYAYAKRVVSSINVIKLIN